ncbi:MAG: formimidoylglutamate deiminase [Actinomycetota bacterium]
MTTWWCEHALVGAELRHRVTITGSDSSAGAAAGATIAAVEAETSQPPGAVRLPGLTLPGFANGHGHAFHRALRSRVQAERGTFWTWRDTMYEVASQLTPERYHRLARAVFAEMAMSGIAAVGEFHYVHHQPDGTPYDDPNEMGLALIAAAAEVGIRLTLLDTIYLHRGITDADRGVVGVQRRFSDGSAERWVERVDRLTGSDHVRHGAAIHSVRAADPDAMAVVAQWADRNNAPLHAHVSEQRAENDQCRERYGCTPTALLESAGALGPNFTAVHATHLTDDDIQRLGRHRCSVCLCPTTERDLGDGIGPSTEVTAAGVTLCIGSDSHAIIDQMVEARAVELDERLRSEQRGLHAAGELMAMATVSGHHSLGWQDAGVIAEGCRADLVTIDLQSVRMAGVADDVLIEAAVFASTTTDITSVVVGGRQIVADGRHVALDASAELTAAITELYR